MAQQLMCWSHNPRAEC